MAFEFNKCLAAPAPVVNESAFADGTKSFNKDKKLIIGDCIVDVANVDCSLLLHLVPVIPVLEQIVSRVVLLESVDKGLVESDWAACVPSCGGELVEGDGLHSCLIILVTVFKEI